MADYQTTLAFLGFLAAFAAAALFLGLRERKRSRDKLVKKLREGFGRPSSKRMSPERYAQVPQYYLRHPKREAGGAAPDSGSGAGMEHSSEKKEDALSASGADKPPGPEREAEAPGFQIDDITWNDLEMDRLFSRMDSTLSACGEEYLYYLLRTPAMRREELPFSQEQYDWCSDGTHEDGRIRIQEILALLGHAGKYSLYEYIDATASLGERSNLPHYAAAAAPFAAFALMFLHTGIGVLVLIAVCSVNLVTYFREKGRIAPFYQTFRYILRLLDCAEALEQALCPPFQEEKERLSALLPGFSGFRRGTAFFLGSAAGGADPLGMILEYARILFHLDLIKFNSMLGRMRDRRGEIDELITICGRIDACISIASWRQTLPRSAVPQLESEAAPPSTGSPVLKTSDGGSIKSVRDGASNGDMGRSENGSLAAPGMPVFSVAGLFHPLLEAPVENSIDARRPVLLTGSNASGKSTFLKAAALCALLSQSVGIAPAAEYRGSFFRIYTSMALRDSLQDGESYFIVEIKSLKRILLAARVPGSSGDAVDAGCPFAVSNPVLCCIDEVLRGTNTVERIAASAEILRCFAQAGAACFAATHDLELTELLGDVYDNYHFGEEIEDGDVRFSYRLQKGPSTSCNAIALLASLGYDGHLVERARARADRFLEKGVWSEAVPF